MIHYTHGTFSDTKIPLDPAAPAFRYGAGFFETICYNGTQLCHLDHHLDRILHSLRAFNIDYDSINYQDVILEVLKRNNLLNSFARINIFYPIEEPKAHPVILAAPFERSPYKAYRICVCSDKHVSMLNAHKTTSYMFFHLAFKEALAKGFNDAALLDFSNNLLECTTGAILLERDGEYIELDSPYRLPSTALELAREVLDITPEQVNINDLSSFRHAYILNSLVGMRPIVSIGETAFVPDEEACRGVTELVLLDEL